MKLIAIALLLTRLPCLAQSSTTPSDPFRSLAFLEGSWTADTQGAAGAAASGTYTFQQELDGHILARHSATPSACKGPAKFDCEHGDLLYIYAEAPAQPLRAIYFDNEGHVLHYDVSTPTPTTAIFLTSPTGPGPQFRLTYSLTNSIMSGKFEMHMPGQTEWTSYLQWKGPKK